MKSGNYQILRSNFYWKEYEETNRVFVDIFFVE